MLVVGNTDLTPVKGIYLKIKNAIEIKLIPNTPAKYLENGLHTFTNGLFIQNFNIFAPLAHYEGRLNSNLATGNFESGNHKGVAVINTLMGMAIDTEARQPVIGNNMGGLSGPAIKPIALLKVHEVYQVCKEHKIPIIGQGGICNSRDSLEFIIAGASAVGIGTALFYDPLVCKEINDGIAEYLESHDMKNVSDLVGSLQLHEN